MKIIETNENDWSAGLQFFSLKRLKMSIHTFRSVNKDTKQLIQNPLW